MAAWESWAMSAFASLQNDGCCCCCCCCCSPRTFCSARLSAGDANAPTNNVAMKEERMLKRKKKKKNRDN